jgi:hypothetical protein
MLSKAFDDFIISQEDWKAIEQEVQMMAQSQQGGAPGQTNTGGGPSVPPQEGAPQGGGGVAAAVVQALQQLPPPLLRAIGNALAQGIPPQQIFQQLMQMQAQASGGAAPQQQGM